MISNTDFEKFWFMYQTEAAGKNISINTYCQQQGIPYNEFLKWYKRTHRQVERLEIIGMPEEVTPKVEESKPAVPLSQPSAKGNILVTIQTGDGLQIQKSGLDYQGLKLLVERMEGLC